VVVDDRVNSSSCSRTSSLLDSDQSLMESTDNEDPTHLHPPRSPDLTYHPHHHHQHPAASSDHHHQHLASSEWSEVSSDAARPVTPRSPSYPLPDSLSGSSSTPDSEVPSGSPPPPAVERQPRRQPQRMLNVFDLPSPCRQSPRANR